METLSLGEQQLVEIAKALALDAKILVLDEPTASLSNNEINELFRVIENSKRVGSASSTSRTIWRIFCEFAMQ